MNLPPQLRCKPTWMLLVLTLIGAQSSPGLVIRFYNPSAHDRFVNFGTAGMAHNPQFIHKDLDLTGVGWDNAKPDRQLTLVSPRHFVGANHFKPAQGATLKFLSADGTVRSYVVAQRESIPNAEGEASDLFLGTLSSDVPAGHGVSFHPYLNLVDEADYAGEQLVVLGKRALGGRNVVVGAPTDVGGDSVIGGGSVNTTRMYSFTYSSVGVGADDAHAEPGDSGSPSFVNFGGVASLVGTHSLVASASVGLATTQTTFDTLVPHYVDELNALMAPEGYHMTAVDPSSTTLSVSQQLGPAVVRAGYPFTIEIDVRNNGSAAANNIKMSVVSPPGTTGLSGNGASWVTSAPAGRVLNAHRGGLAAAGSAPFSLSLTVPQPGSKLNEVEVSADESGATSTPLSFNVIESYRSWSSGLANSQPNADGDFDGIGALLEYAFGGNPQSNSPYHPGTTVLLLPRISVEGDLVLRYLARKDAAQRALEYRVEFSHDLTEGSWADADSLVISSDATSLNANFEEREVHLALASSPRCFVRVRVTLGE